MHATCVLQMAKQGKQGKESRNKSLALQIQNIATYFYIVAKKFLFNQMSQ